MPTSTLYTHYLYNMQKHCQEANYVQNHNNIIRYNISVARILSGGALFLAQKSSRPFFSRRPQHTLKLPK